MVTVNIHFRLVQIYLKKDISPSVTIDALYAFTQCEISISPNCCVIKDGKPVFTSVNDVLKICHAPTNRFYKGSERIIEICRLLEKQGKIEFDLIENLPHSVALDRKSNSDIFIDQIGNKGGWGYGMNSIESLSMGICTLTEMNDEYNDFLNLNYKYYLTN